MRLSGHAAVFNEWTRIDSVREGLFLERVSPGAFKKTIAESRGRIRVLLSHGHDPELGDKPLGPLEELREDKRGLYYEARLLDGVPPLVVSGLREGLYGASFRFSAIREEFVQRPGTSTHNPDGLPERTLREVRLHELGPTPFPAYEGATAAARAAGEIVELRAVAGREEIFPRSFASGSDPATVRRLRADGGTRAQELLRELDRGGRVEITWGGSGRSLGRVLERPRSGRGRDYLTDKPWRLPEPSSWRL